MCPGSLKITMRALQRGAQMELPQVLKMEYRLAVRSTVNHDFPEGTPYLNVYFYKIHIFYKTNAIFGSSKLIRNNIFETFAIFLCKTCTVNLNCNKTFLL